MKQINCGLLVVYRLERRSSGPRAFLDPRHPSMRPGYPVAPAQRPLSPARALAPRVGRHRTPVGAAGGRRGLSPDMRTACAQPEMAGVDMDHKVLASGLGPGGHNELDLVLACLPEDEAAAVRSWVPGRAGGATDPLAL